MSDAGKAATPTSQVIGRNRPFNQEYLEAGDDLDAIRMEADELHAEIAQKKCRSCGEWDGHTNACKEEQ